MYDTMIFYGSNLSQCCEAFTQFPTNIANVVKPNQNNFSALQSEPKPAMFAYTTLLQVFLNKEKNFSLLFKI